MITVWMPVYNEADYLSAAIESVLTQDYQDFKFVISNNHSTDGSDLIIKKYADIDNRIVSISPPNFLSSLEHGNFISESALNLLDSKYSAFIGGHDLWNKNLLTTLVSRVNNSDEFSVIYTDSCEIDERNNILKKWDGIIHSTQIPRPFIPQHFLLGLTHNIIWGGLWNERVRKQIFPSKYNCCGVDHFQVAEAALLGDVIYHPGSCVFLRRPKCYSEGIKGYVNKHINASLASQSDTDFICQLEWASSLIDKAVYKNPIYEQDIFKSNLKISLLSGYIMRYYGHLLAFDGAFEKFFQTGSVQKIIANNIDSSSLLEELFKSLTIKNQVISQ